jgi:ABC-type Fe3+ transport system substrate-binding protein
MNAGEIIARVDTESRAGKVSIDANLGGTSTCWQLAEWVARGEYPIGIALVQFAVEIYRKQGLPLERIFPKDGQGSLTGGFSVVMLIKNAPHPNAAQLFANWFATKEAQTIYESQMMETSLRTDISGTNVPDYVRPKEGTAYPIDDYSYEHYSKIRQPVIERLQKELQR